MKKIVCFIAALLMASLCGCKDQQQVELTEKAPDGSYAIEYSTAETTVQATANSQKPTELLVLESNIFNEVYTSDGCFAAELFDDFDGDGIKELFAIYSADGKTGDFWFSDAKEARKLSTSVSCNSLHTIELEDKTIILAERMLFIEEIPECSRSCCYYYIDGELIKIDTHKLGRLEKTGENELTGYGVSYDACTDGTGVTYKPYWLDTKYFLPYYGTDYLALHSSDGSFEHINTQTTNADISNDSDILLSHSYENDTNSLDFELIRPYTEEITSLGGEITEIFVRDNGIVNINYIIKREGYEHLADRYFRNIRVTDEKAEDITPTIISDGKRIFDNRGRYENYLIY